MLGLPAGIACALAAALALGWALALTPLAIAVARRSGHLDRPSGWKSHASPTPFLGGAAVLAATAAASLMLGAGGVPWQLLGATAGLALLGSADDQRQLKAWPRVLAEALAAALVHRAGLGWELGPGWLDLALTVAWVLAAVNALNLIDLMDGVAASVAAVSAIAVAALAALNGDDGLALAAAAGAGACVGFLRFNLASPARVFLGDGGTMPIGLLLAVAIVAAVQPAPAAAQLASAALLLAVPLADMAHRIAARRRRGVSPLTPGPDSVANLLAARLGSPARVCGALAGAQLLAGTVAILIARAA